MRFRFLLLALVLYVGYLSLDAYVASFIHNPPISSIWNHLLYPTCQHDFFNRFIVAVLLFVFALIVSKRRSQILYRDEKLIFETTKFKTILDMFPNPVIVMDTEMNVLWHNQESEKYADNIDNIKCFASLEGRSSICEGCVCLKTLQTGKTESGIVYHEYILKKTDPVFFDTTCIPIKTSTGKIVNLVKIAKDITHERAETQKYMMINEIMTDFMKIEGNLSFEKALNSILDYMKSPYGVFGYCDEHDNLVCASMTNVSSECKMDDKSFIFPHESWTGAWGQALMDQQTVISNEEGNVPEGHIAMKRVMATPIIYDGCVIGVLTIANATTDYDSLDAQKLEDIASLLAPILSCKIQQLEHENE